MGLRRGNFFWLRLTTACVQCLRLSDRLFHFVRFDTNVHRHLSILDSLKGTSRECILSIYITAVKQQRRSVVKSEGRGHTGQAIKLFQMLLKMVLPSIFDTSLSSFMLWGLQSCPTTVLSERM